MGPRDGGLGDPPGDPIVSDPQKSQTRRTVPGQPLERARASSLERLSRHGCRDRPVAQQGRHETAESLLVPGDERVRSAGVPSEGEVGQRAVAEEAERPGATECSSEGVRHRDAGRPHVTRARPRGNLPCRQDRQKLSTR
jgi:hypothetical protein